MAKLVLIDTGTYKPGINNIGDKVSIHEDTVDLSGPAYTTFKILQVGQFGEFTKENIITALRAWHPAIKIAHRLATNLWTFAEPEKMPVWRDETNLAWKQVVVRPTYPHRITVTQPLIDALMNGSLTKVQKLQALKSAYIANVSDNASNQMGVTELG